VEVLDVIQTSVQAFGEPRAFRRKGRKTTKKVTTLEAANQRRRAGALDQ